MKSSEREFSDDSEADDHAPEPENPIATSRPRRSAAAVTDAKIQRTIAQEAIKYQAVPLPPRVGPPPPKRAKKSPPVASGGLAGCRCLDLTFLLSEAAAGWPSAAPLEREVIKTPACTEAPGARSKQAVKMNLGSGTHIDAPAHFVADGRTVDQLTAVELAGVPLALIDVTTDATADHAYLVNAAAIAANEERHGPLLPGSLVCIRTGWAEARYEAGNAQYRNAADPNDIDVTTGFPRMVFPGIAADAAALLLERGVVGIGIDTLSPDGGSCAAGRWEFHNTILAANRYIIENLRLTAELPARGSLAFVSPLNVAGAPEAPARVWAAIPE